jgi:ADP-ribose pyrophosphatase
MPYRLIGKKSIYNGKKVSLEVHDLENESTLRHVQREICVHPGAVVVLPLLPENQVILIRNYRYSVGQVLLELPAGTLEKGEDPMDCAGRELIEETGYKAGRLEALPMFFTSPGVLTEKMYPFIAYDLQKTQQALEEGEEIELHPVPMKQAVDMCFDGQIADGKTVATILRYVGLSLKRQDLRFEI